MYLCNCIGHKKGTTHVEAFMDFAKDAGSIPATSTKLNKSTVVFPYVLRFRPDRNGDPPLHIAATNDSIKIISKDAK